MKRRKNLLAVVAVGAGLAFGVSPALAEEAFQDWGSVANEALAEERGMAFDVDEDALAKAIGAQNQHVEINGSVVGDAAVIKLGTHTFDGQVMSVNVINSGHNNVFQVQNVVAVTVSGGLPQ